MGTGDSSGRQNATGKNITQFKKRFGLQDRGDLQDVVEEINDLQQNTKFMKTFESMDKNSDGEITFEELGSKKLVGKMRQFKGKSQEEVQQVLTHLNNAMKAYLKVEL